MITKKLLNNKEIPEMIRKCYESDKIFIEKYHELSGSSVNECINRSINDFFVNNIDIYSLYSNNKFVGYFGDNKANWLVGFFIMPEMRKYKKEVWNIIESHFDGNFKMGILTKNKPAKKFFIENGCKFSHCEFSLDGLGEIYIKENK